MKKVSFLIFYISLAACNNPAQSSGEAHGTTPHNPTAPAIETAISKTDKTGIYELRSTDDRTEDEFAPMGFWQKQITAPFIKAGGTQQGRNEANSIIETLTHQYACNEPGEQSFNTEVTFASEKIISFTYESMWMCSSMPHPDSISGSMTIDITNGNQIDIESQLEHGTIRDELISLVTTGLNDFLTKKEGVAECPAINGWQDYYVTGTSIVFTYSSKIHGDTLCDAEFSIPKANASKYLTKGSILRN